MPKFIINDDDGWRETEERPDFATLQELRARAKDMAAKAHKHSPGDGWHYVPGEPEFVLNYSSDYWWVCQPTSEGAILAQTKVLCEAYGCSFQVLQKLAYPNEEPYEPDVDDYSALVNPLSVPDVGLALDDLTDVNYHSLRSIIEDALAKEG